MTVIAAYKKANQNKDFAGASVNANPLHDLIYVDSVNGVDTNYGHQPRRAVKTLYYALSIAEAGDTIVCNPGGTESRATALEMDIAGVSIICPSVCPSQNYALTITGDAHGILIDAAKCRVSGLKIGHTGTTTNRAGIVVLGGDGSTAEESGREAYIHNNVLNNTDTAGKTDYGVYLVGNTKDTHLDGNIFRGCAYGVYIADHASDTDANLRTVLSNNKYFVGASAAFGIYSDGAVQVDGLLVMDDVFFEADGDGSAATAAWDGTTGTNATQGTMKLAATADQCICVRCTSYSASAATFENISNVVSGATVDFIDSKTGEGDATDAAIAAIAAAVVVIDAFHDVPTKDSTDDVVMSDVIGKKDDTALAAADDTKSLQAHAKGILTDTAGLVTDFGTIVNAGGAANLGAALGDFANVTLVSRLDTIDAFHDVPAKDSTDDVVMSDVIGKKDDTALAAADDTKSLQAHAKGILTDTAGLVTDFGTIVNAGGAANLGAALGDFANVTLVARLDLIDGYHDVPTKDSTDDAQMRDVIGKKDDTALGAPDDTKSLQAHVKGLFTAEGTCFCVVKTLVCSAILQTGVDVTGVSTGGGLFLMNAIMQTDGVGMANATNIQLESDNTDGAAVFFEEAVANLGANKTVDLDNASVVNNTMLLEMGKKIIARATVADGTGAGEVNIYLCFKRGASGADVSAA